MPPFDDEFDDELIDDWDEYGDDLVGLGDEGRPGFRAALFSSQAKAYKLYRPSYPEHVYRRIFEFAESAMGRAPGTSSQELALDVGCGPGNVAKVLAKTFAQVIGVDPSQDQLDNAIQLPNVRYLKTAAEYLSEHLPPESVDLIAMAETLHWVDHMAFYEQCRKVLKPNGAVAIWCYDLTEFTYREGHPDDKIDQANALMRAYTYGVLGPFWDERRVFIDRKYAGLEPKESQFRVCLREEGSMDHTMSLDHFIGYLTSWSPHAAYRATYPHKPDPLVDLRKQLRELLGVKDDAADNLVVRFPLFFLFMRDPVPPPEVPGGLTRLYIG